MSIIMVSCKDQSGCIKSRDTYHSKDMYHSDDTYHSKDMYHSDDAYNSKDTYHSNAIPVFRFVTVRAPLE